MPNGRPQDRHHGHSIASPLLAAQKGEILPRLIVFGFGFVLVAAVVPYAGQAIFFATALYVLRGSRQVVEGLLVLALMIMINKAIVPVDISLLRWVVLAAAAGRVLYDTVISDSSVPPVFWVLLVYTGTLVLFSLLASQLPIVSLFKSISFFLGTATALIAIHRTRHLTEYWKSWLISISVFLILGSLPLYSLHAYGFARNGVGFQGLLTHPQTYGPVTAVLTAYVSGLVIFEGRRGWVLRLTALAGVVGVYFSQSRTGMLALILSVCIVLILGFIRSRTWLPRIRRALGGVKWVVALVCLGFVGLIFARQFSEGIERFLLKDEAAQDVTGALEESRLSLIEQSMSNFREAPVTGIGLGVPSNLAATHIEYGFWGLPVGASVEKGFQPAAVLEETGLGGAALLIILLAMLIWPVLVRGSISLAWMIFATLLINLGEAILFALGGNGLFVWMIFGLGYIIADQDGGLPELPATRRTDARID